MRVVNRKKISTIVLMGAMFLNPLGYDALFYMVLKITGNSYVTTTSIFYLSSASLFGVYFYLLKINPFIYILTSIKSKVRQIGRKK